MTFFLTNRDTYYVANFSNEIDGGFIVAGTGNSPVNSLTCFETLREGQAKVQVE